MAPIQQALRAYEGLFGPGEDWEQRLQIVESAVRAISDADTPDQMMESVSILRQRIPIDRSVAVGRRLESGRQYRITRSSLWEKPSDPWNARHELPLVEGGLLGRLLFAGRPCVIDKIEFAPDDPAAEHLEGMSSMLAIPQLDHGNVFNMVFWMREEPGAYSPEVLPEVVMIVNLFGRAVHNKVMSSQIQEAFDLVDREMRVVSGIQQALLPRQLPCIPGLCIAAHYETASRAGGDYYDLFELPDGRLGILIADVCGHGAAAAVLMAITHAILHTCKGLPENPGEVLDYLNAHLTEKYTRDSRNFVTAFYGVYDPDTRELVYADAGHEPPRVRSASGDVTPLEMPQNMPLGLYVEHQHAVHRRTLAPGDLLVFYTDGITERLDHAGAIFCDTRLDDVIRTCPPQPEAAMKAILDAVETFANGRPPHDDATLLIARID